MSAIWCAERSALPADRKTGHALLLADVEELELDANRALAGIRRVTDDEVVLLEEPPRRELDVGLARRRLDDVGLRQRAELARAREIGAHDLADIGVGRQAAAVEAERHDGNRDGGRIAVGNVDGELLCPRRRRRERQERGDADEHEREQRANRDAALLDHRFHPSYLKLNLIERWNTFS
jgi:hypothetical protein